MSAKFEGTVKFFNEEKGFGFIRQEGTNDIFFHVSEVQKGEPDQGDTVTYYPKEGKRGMVGTSVEVIKKADKDQFNGGNRRENRRPFKSHKKTNGNGQSIIRRVFLTDDFGGGFQPA